MKPIYLITLLFIAVGICGCDCGESPVYEIAQKEDGGYSLILGGYTWFIVILIAIAVFLCVISFEFHHRGEKKDLKINDE